MARDFKRICESLSDRDREALLACARMPYLSARDLGALVGVHNEHASHTLDRLGFNGLGAKTFHGSVYGKGTSRWRLTADGVRAVAYLSGLKSGEVMRRLPTSAGWQRRILSRVDAAAVFYGLAGAASASLGRQCKWHWRGRGWFNGSLEIGEEKILQVSRNGAAVPRRSVLYRMGGMMNDAERNRVYGVIFIAADYAQMRLMERWLKEKAGRIGAWVAHERDIMERPVERIWSRPARRGLFYADLDYMLESALEGSEASRRWAVIPDVYGSVALPVEIESDDKDLAFAGMSKGAKRILNAAMDWPLAKREDFEKIAGLTYEYCKKPRAELRANNLAASVSAGGRTRLCVADEGLRRIAQRDQVHFRFLRDRWGVRANGREYEIAGGALLELAKNIQHTDGLYKFVGDLTEECAASAEASLREILPAHRSERWLPDRKRVMRAAKPDAAGALEVEGKDVPFMVEYERRADRPSAFSQKLDPYLAYYATSLRIEDWFTRVRTLFVFADRASAGGFARFCEDKLRDRPALFSRLPAFIGAAEDIAEAGALGANWLRVGGLDEGLRRFWD